MKKISGDHYVALWSLCYAGQAVTMQAIAMQGKIKTGIMSGLIRDMMSADFCDGSEWVYSRKLHGVELFSIAGRRGDESGSTGGWQALHESANNATIVQMHASAWKDEALTGITPDGKQSKIENAVL